MKKFRLNAIASLLAIIPIGATLNSCTQEQEMLPKVSLTEVLSDADKLTFLIDVEDAVECYYYYEQGTQISVSADEVISKGVKLSEAMTQNVTISSLEPSTDYCIIAAASANGKSVLSNTISMRTSDASHGKTSVEIVAGDSNETELNFTVIPSNADKCSYMCIEKSDDVPSASDIFSKGIALEDPSKASFCTIKDLSPKTEYMIVAAASLEDDAPVVSEPVYMTTNEPAAGSEMKVYIQDVKTTYSSITFTIVPQNAGEAAYDYELKTPDYEYRDAFDVFSKGKAVESAMNPTTITLDGLRDDTEYVIYAAVESASSYDKVMTYVEVKTDKRPDAEELPMETMSEGEMTYNNGRNFTVALENDNYSVLLDFNPESGNPYYLPHIPEHEYVYVKEALADQSWILNALTSVTSKANDQRLNIVKGSMTISYEAPVYDITGRLVTDDNKAFNFEYHGNIPYLLKADKGAITNDGGNILTINCPNHTLIFDFGNDDVMGQHTVGETISIESSLEVPSEGQAFKFASGSATIVSPSEGQIDIDALITLDNGDMVVLKQQGVDVTIPEDPGTSEIIFDKASARGGPDMTGWLSAYDITLENDEWSFYIAFETSGEYDELPEGKLMYSSWGGGEISAYTITKKSGGFINDVDEGYLDIRKEGDEYKIELHFVRTSMEEIDGRYTGPVECVDMSGAM